MPTPATPLPDRPPLSRAARIGFTVAFVVLLAGVIGALVALGRVAPTLRENHKGWGRADCTICHPPARTHPDDGYTPDSCAGCHGPNGAKRTDRTHEGRGRADCFASGCHAAARTHAGRGFTLAGCAACHGANGLDAGAGAAK